VGGAKDKSVPPLIEETETRTRKPGWKVRRIRPRAFERVPTHVVGVARERRLYPRAALRLTVQLKRVAGQPETAQPSLMTRNISSSGVYFFSPLRLEPGTPIQLVINLVDRPFGRGSVRMATEAHVVRVDPTNTEGWHGVAVHFDDITFYRDETLPKF